MAERQQSPFGRVYGYSVLSIFLFHLFINIGMVLGLTPVIGIPLPFFSYGGSSLWGFTILLFYFPAVDAGRNRRILVMTVSLWDIRMDLIIITLHLHIVDIVM